ARSSPMFASTPALPPRSATRSICSCRVAGARFRAMRARVLVLLVLFACGDNREVTPPDGPTGCQAAADCNDHDACTDDTCSAGTCEHAPKLVDDQIECTADACDPQTGTVMHTPIDS